MAVIFVCLSVASGGCAELSALATSGKVGAGMVARTLCTTGFVQGREPASVRAEELGPLVDPRLEGFSVRLRAERGEVEASYFGLFDTKAGFAPGLGCALGRDGVRPDPPLHPPADPRPFPIGDAAGPAAAANASAIGAIADDLFGTADRAAATRTRSFLVVHEGELVFERHAPGFDGRLPQFGASMAKTVTAMLAGVLVGEGKLALADRALMRDWADERVNITVAHLLRMESGLAFEEHYSGNSDTGLMLYASASASAMAASRPLKTAPGTRFSYSSGDTNILMAVMRARSGRDDAAWAAFPRAVLFEPLGLKSAIFEQDAGGDFVGSTFVYASALDWARLGLLLAQDGAWSGKRILPDGWVRTMTTPSALSGGRYGAQTWLRGHGPGAETAPLIEFSGYGGQMVLVHPATRTVIVHLGFNPDPDALDRAGLIRRMLTALSIDVPENL